MGPPWAPPGGTRAGRTCLRDATFAVTGMTCASCSAVIEKVVGKLAGVESVTVNLATEKMSVRFDPSVIDEAGIAAAVKKAGYGRRSKRAGRGGGPCAPPPSVAAAPAREARRPAPSRSASSA